MVMAVQPGVGTGDLVEGERAARAGTDVNPALEVFAELLRAARRADEGDDVALDRLSHGDLMNLSAGGEDRLLCDDFGLRGTPCGLRLLAADEAHHLELIGIARIPYHDVQQEAIALSFWPRISTFLLNRVLRRQHHE